MDWNQEQIEEGTGLLDHALHLHQAPEQFQIQAAIAALHTESKSALHTDWHEITLLYKTLLNYNNSAVVKLNYAVALSMTGAVVSALRCLNNLKQELKDYHPFYLVRAELMIMANRDSDAKENFQHALVLCRNKHQQNYIKNRIKLISEYH